MSWRLSPLPHHVRNRRIAMALAAGFVLMIGWIATGSGHSERRPETSLREIARIPSDDGRYDAVVISEQPPAIDDGNRPATLYRVTLVLAGNKDLSLPMQGQFDAEPRVEWVTNDEVAVTITGGQVLNFNNVAYIGDRPDQRIGLRLKDLSLP